MAKTQTKKKLAKPAGKPRAAAAPESRGKSRELTEAELEKVAGGVAVVKRTRL